MYHFKRALQKTKIQIRQISIARILPQWGRWLKQKKYALALVLLGGVVLRFALGRPVMVTLQGETMCMPYRIQYLEQWGKNYQQEIDTLLVRLHQSLSTSLPDSELSRFNEHDCSEFYFESPFFYPIFAKSREVYRNTAGAFDPTVSLLINTRESCPAHATDSDSLPSNALCERVGLDCVVANAQRIKKLKEDVKLDFGGILKGYAVDKIADLLRAHGIEHMYIAIGNEAIAYGKPSRHNEWHMDIHTNLAFLADTELQITMELVDRAMSISSSSKQGKPPLTQDHIIDPSTGYPARHTLLAAAVVGKDCSTADAYATALMVRGVAFAQELLAQQKELVAFLIYEDDHGALAFYSSSGLHVQQKDHTIILRPTQGAS
jgi:FAD:protein FMN transferase